jgi:hypothetical protein
VRKVFEINREYWCLLDGKRISDKFEWENWEKPKSSNSSDSEISPASDNSEVSCEPIRECINAYLVERESLIVRGYTANQIKTLFVLNRSKWCIEDKNKERTEARRKECLENHAVRSIEVRDSVVDKIGEFNKAKPQTKQVADNVNDASSKPFPPSQDKNQTAGPTSNDTTPDYKLVPVIPVLSEGVSKQDSYFVHPMHLEPAGRPSPKGVELLRKGERPTLILGND